jgi:hypothetical protein
MVILFAIVLGKNRGINKIIFFEFSPIYFSTNENQFSLFNIKDAIIESGG